MTHDIADYTPLLSHPSFTEKLRLAERIQADATARKRSTDDTANTRVNWRAQRRGDLQDMLRRSRDAARRIENHNEIEAELARLDDGERDFRHELSLERAGANAEYQAAVSPVAAALDWLSEQRADWRAAGEPEGEWLRHAAVSLKAKPSVELVRDLRAKIEDIEHQALDVRRRPTTAAELKANLDAALADVAKLGRLNLDPRQRRTDCFGLLDKIAEPHMILPAHGSVSGASAVLFALFEPELRQHFHEQIDAADLTAALSSDQQERELTRLADKRLKLEREEEAVICGLEADGLPVQRRADLDPRALLEVEDR